MMNTFWQLKWLGVKSPWRQTSRLKQGPRLVCWQKPMQKRVDNIRSDIANILSKARISKDNIDKQDRDNIKHLTKNEDILILPADKGKAAVVMDKEEYNSKLNKMVSDTKVYQQLKSDATPAFKRKLIAILTRLNVKRR